MNAPHQPTAPLHVPGPVFGSWSTQTEQQMFHGTPGVPANPATPAEPAPAAPAPAAPAAPPAAPAVPAPAAPAKTYTPEETAAYVASVREEARQNRLAKEAAEQTAAEATNRTAAVLAALGLNVDGTTAPPTPEKLQEQLSARDQQANTVARENVVLRIGTRPDVSANVDKLLDSRTFTDKLAKLAVDDRAGIEALIKETLENDGSYKAIIPAASSGSTTPTGQGTPPTARKSKDAAIAERYATSTPK